MRVAATVLAAAALAVRTSAAEGSAAPPYRDPSAQVQDRVQDLL
jgi:hypothetical protein